MNGNDPHQRGKETLMTGITKGSRVVFPVTAGGLGRENHRTLYREGTVVSTRHERGGERARIRENSDRYAGGRGYVMRPVAVLVLADSQAGQQRLAEGTWNDRYTEWERAGKPTHSWRPLVPGATACWQCGHQNASVYHTGGDGENGTSGPAPRRENGMHDTTRWHPSPGTGRQDRDLFGPYWAEVSRRRHHSMPMEDADPAAWSWAILRINGDERAKVAAGTAPDEQAAKQAVNDWLTEHGPLDADWRMWNVIAPVVAVLSAPSSAEALDRLTRALKAAGFEVYDDPAAAPVSLAPFEAEDGTEESDPPPAGWPW